MKSGDLDQRVLIEVPASGFDALGQEDLTWQELGGAGNGSRSAKVIEEKGMEFLAGGNKPERQGAYFAEEKIAVVIRWMAVDSTARLTWGGRVWRVVSVTGTRRQGWAWLHCISTQGAN